MSTAVVMMRCSLAVAASVISFTAFARVFSDISASERNAPWAWSCFATARPMPPRPVTTYTLSWKEFMVWQLFDSAFAWVWPRTC